MLLSKVSKFRDDPEREEDVCAILEHEEGLRLRGNKLHPSTRGDPDRHAGYTSEEVNTHQDRDSGTITAFHDRCDE